MIFLSENFSSITYDDDWRSVSTAEYAQINNSPENGEENNEPAHKPKKKKSDSPKQYLITIQLIVCILIALAAFALKAIGGDIYVAAREWYYSNLNSTVIFTGGDNHTDLSKIFSGSTADEA